VSRVDTLERLAALRDRGAITNDEYQAEKTQVVDLCGYPQCAR
jgi:hypothetical protein